MSVCSHLSLRWQAVVPGFLGLVPLLAHCTSEPPLVERDAGGTVAQLIGPLPSMPGPCTYKDDASFCACLGMNDVDGGGKPFDCGGVDGNDAVGVNQAVYCGACPPGQYCQASVGNVGGGFGHCTPGNPVQYPYQKQKMDMLVSIGEADTPLLNFGSASNIGDGRGYTITTIGFTTGTGDFIFVAACYNDAKPGNVLQKYWGHRNSAGQAIDGLILYNDLFVATGNNQPDTSMIDSLGTTCKPTTTMNCFQQDVSTAGADPVFVACARSIADAFDLAPAAQHAQERGFSGALTLGFLYDTEINFGDADDPMAPGVQTVMKMADKDYGAGLPTSFAAKPWEESRWLGFFIKERAIIMSKDPTWRNDMDQNATWEAARRLHTAASNNPESMTDLGMDYDFTSAYKAGSTNFGPMTMANGCPGSMALTPCFGDPPLATNWDTCNSVYVLSTNKAASATDPTQWTAAAAAGASYMSCPANPTP
jgi:hypothetical protein